MDVHENFPLLHRNTFAVEAKAAKFVEYYSVKELKEALGDFCGRKCGSDRNLFVGQGSNLLFTKDFGGTVFHGCISDVDVAADEGDSVLVSVGAGMLWDDFVAWCVGNSLYGAENLSLIPGEVGAAAVQNIGAYGSEVSGIIESVEAFDVCSLEAKKFTARDCGYSYRHSFFKDNPGKFAVHHVVFRLSRTFVPNLEYKALEKEFAGRAGRFGAKDVREFVIGMRRAKLPDPKILGNAGSFFMNPVVSGERFAELRKAFPDIPHFATDKGIKIPAAWLIQQCGWKGRRMGNAGVYEKQPLVIVNLGGAKADEIVSLSKCVTDDVLRKFGITLKPEVQFV